MKAAFTMWKNTRMILLTALCAAIYGAALAAFKTAIPLIPGITEVRVANIFPMVFGLLFGPAGAWGSAFGNLIGDVFGTLGPGSFFGFFGNFLLGFVPYALWTRLKPLSSGDEPALRTPHQWLEYLVLALVSSAACATFISWGVHLLGLVPFQVLSPIITINDTVGSWIGGILLLLVYGRIKSMGLLWQDVMDKADIGEPLNARIGAILMIIGGVGGWLVGAYLVPGNMAIVAIFFVLIIISAFLL